jgi:hypothetical protein
LLSWLSQDHRQPVSPFEKKGNAFSIWTGFHSSVLNSSEILEWQFEREIVAIDYKHKKARPKIDRAQKDEFILYYAISSIAVTLLNEFKIVFRCLVNMFLVDGGKAVSEIMELYSFRAVFSPRMASSKIAS